MDDKKKKIIAIVVAVVVAITAIVVAVVVVNKKDNDKAPEGVVVDQIGENGEVQVDENGVIIAQNENSNGENGSNNGNATNNGGNGSNNGNAVNNGGSGSNNGGNAAINGGSGSNNGGNATNNGGNGSNNGGSSSNGNVTPTKRNIALTVQLPAINQESQLIVIANGVEVENRKVLQDTEVSNSLNREETFELVNYTGAVEIQVKLVNNAKTLDESVVTNDSSVVINLRDNDIDILPQVIE